MPRSSQEWIAKPFEGGFVCTLVDFFDGPQGTCGTIHKTSEAADNHRAQLNGWVEKRRKLEQDAIEKRRRARLSSGGM